MEAQLTNKPKLSDRHIDAFGYAIHPKRFMLWLAIASMIMMFGAFTSAYLVKKADTINWLNFQLPQIFNYSTIVVILSSVVFQMGYRYYKKGLRKKYLISLMITLILGLIFLAFQWIGWKEMSAMGMVLDGNASGSFTYVISGTHAVHLIGGLIAIMMTLIYSGLKKKNLVEDIMQKTNQREKLYLELVLTFWHFVGILWVYLFIFFKLNQ